MAHVQVIIVGAGPAGIAAASRLLENNVTNFLIVEAEDRIGGRVYTSELDGQIVEIGAEWIHGEKENAVYELAAKFDLVSNDTAPGIFNDTTFYKSGNLQVDKKISQTLCQLYEQIIYAPKGDEKATGSLGDYFMREYRKGVEELRGEIDISRELENDFAQIFEKWENSIDASDSWYETSLPGHYEYWECEGNIVTNWKGNGYRTLFDLLEKSPCRTSSEKIEDKVIFKKKVVQIVWNKNNLTHLPNVMVECSDRTIYTGNHAIVTCSLGFLKENAETFFRPPLSQKKLECIKGLGFGTVDKIFLKFPYQWWTEDKDGFAFLWSEEDKKTDKTGWLSDVIAFHPVRPDSKILRGWVVGESARRMEAASDSEVLDECMRLLEKFLGFKYQIPRAEAIMRSTWYSNPNFRGSYSFRSIESDKKGVWARDLALPECNVLGKPLLLFAGEATHEHYFSTVHGAIESGRREADRLLTKELGDGVKDSYDVVIIGAGISGLAAAKTLNDEGITDVLIVEADDVPGGRIRSVQVGDDWLELGAQWIHGDKNEMFELCRSHDLITDKFSQEGQGLYLRENGDIVDEELVQEMDDLIKTVLEDCEDYVTGESDCPVSIGDELESKFGDYLNRCDDPEVVKDAKRDLFYWHVRFLLIDNSCDDLRDLSAKAWGLYRFCGGNDYINFRLGYKSLVDLLIGYIPRCKIAYSTEAEVVEWRTEETGVRDVGTRSARINCAGNLRVDTDYVIVTSSLGYLKSNHEKMFRPPLPPELTEAIRSLGFGVLGKLFLIYESRWWEPEVKGFQLVWSHKRSHENRIRHWGYDLTGFDVIIDDRPILLGWVAGDGARIVEGLTEERIKAESTEILRKFTGRSDIPLPVRVLKSEWFSNEYVRGGYSHIRGDYDRNGLDGSSLSKPVFTRLLTEDGETEKPTILLAGEAVHQSHFSTVHGAYESGVSQAHVVARDIKSRRR